MGVRAKYGLCSGVLVTLCHEDDCIVPAGNHFISQVNPDGSFHVGGNTAVWPRRVTRICVSGEWEVFRA